jgi:hypothetical protein
MNHIDRNEMEKGHREVFDEMVKTMLAVKPFPRFFTKPLIEYTNHNNDLHVVHFLAYMVIVKLEDSKTERLEEDFAFMAYIAKMLSLLALKLRKIQLRDKPKIEGNPLFAPFFTREGTPAAKFAETVEYYRNYPE